MSTRPRWQRSLAALVAMFALAGVAAACIWDTHTLRDELQTKADDFDLITGQFPHHGSAYYEARVRQATGHLGTDPSSIEARNDLAVALLKLGRFDEARAEFERIEAAAPGRYETRSNLGVLEKKAGNFAKAAEYTAAALAIKPEGHLGLGDYYLRMLAWQAARAAAPDAVPTETFFGSAYGANHWNTDTRLEPSDDPKRPTRVEIDPARLRALIRSDREFADAIFILADRLHSRFDLNLALWAYVRALDLGHPQAALIDKRIDAIFDHWRSAIPHRTESRVLETRPATLAAIREGLAQAVAWRERFAAVEAELVAADPEADFVAVEAAMAQRGMERWRPTRDAGIVPGGLVGHLNHRSGVLVFAAGLSLFGACAIWWLRRRRAAATAPRLAAR